MAKEIPVPPTAVPEIYVTPIEEFNPSEIDNEIAFQLTALASLDDNKVMLDLREARKIAKDYGTSQRATARRLHELRDHEDHSELVVHDSSVRIMGTATVTEPTLYEQHGNRQSWIERRWGNSAMVMLAPTYQVFGWVSTTYSERLGGVAAYEAVYSGLRELAPDSYAIEPVYTDHYVLSGIGNAGFERIGDEERYDVGGRGIPQLSRFYRSLSATTRTFENPNGLENA